MKTIPLTVLASEGPQARTYLATMRQAGIRPERIILIVSSVHPATRKPIAPWLPSGIRRGIAARVQDASANAWPRRIRARFPFLVDACVEALKYEIDNPRQIIDEIAGSFVYEKYADHVERIMAKGLSDPVLSDFLKSLPPTAVLFTGGGIIRKNLLDIEGLKFIHIHPGYLPDIRGGDGLLWSILLRGKPGSSSFFMDSGIDTGDLIVAREFGPIQIDLGSNPRPDNPTLYRSVFCYVDPLYRSALLVRDVLSLGENPLTYPSASQDINAGVTYHFLHATLRDRVLEKLFIGTD